MSLLEISRLTKHFGGLTAVYDLSFSLDQGEILGLIGPNGAGKTTVFNLVSGFIPPSSGTVTFDGRSVTNLRPHQICQLGLTRTFQVVQPFPDMTVLENVMIGAFVRHGRPAEAENKAREVLKRVALDHKAATPGRSLTLLELKRLEIGKALATEPRLLLLDEVASGLNMVEVEDVLALVRQLNREGITFLIVEHVMKVIMSLCRRIIVLDFGKKIGEGTPQHVSRDQAVLEAYLGEEEYLA
ncbi:MAG TPA: ABC transporter ATP-binding protein [Anaerolineales bacterium]|nr:ABC transporter ATP-binding protein [Anaerolineales bacterium]